MNHVESVLDFQRRLIRSAMMAPRLEAMNLLGIVYSNLEEFVENRFARCSDPQAILESLYDIYDIWASAVYQKFPSLCNENQSYQRSDFYDVDQFLSINYYKLVENTGVIYAGRGKGTRYFHKFAFNETLPIDDVDNVNHVMDLKNYARDGYTVVASDEQLVPPPKAPMTNSKVAKLTASALAYGNGGISSFPVTYAPSQTGLQSPHLIGIDYEMNSDKSNFLFVRFIFKYPIMVGFDKAAKVILKHYDRSGSVPQTLVYREAKTCNVYEKAIGPHTMVVPDEYFHEDEMLVRLPAFMRLEDDNSLTPVTAARLAERFAPVCSAEFNRYLQEAWFTIYRVDAEEDEANAAFIIRCAAALGKKCHVYIEMRARGEEKTNLKLYRKIKELGADVNLIPHHEKAFDKKVHAKVWLFRFDNPVGSLNGGRVALVSTGNFSITAQTGFRDTIYLRKCTTKKGFERYIAMFDTLIKGARYDWSEGVDSPFVWEPKAIAQRITDEINRKITDATIDSDNGDEPKHFIWIKANHIVDPAMVRLITEAATVDGLEVHVIARTACTLPLNVPYPDYEVHSVVGKYLEHDRFYIFGHYEGGCPIVDVAFISSADLMKRNLYERVELLQRLPRVMGQQVVGLFDNMFRSESNPAIGFFNYPLTRIGELDFLIDCETDENTDMLHEELDS